MQNKNDQSDKGGGVVKVVRVVRCLRSDRVIEVVKVGRVVGLVCDLQNLKQIDPEQQVAKQLSQFANLQNELFATLICKKFVWKNNLQRSCPEQ